jgi:hypothetical protein
LDFFEVHSHISFLGTRFLEASHQATRNSVPVVK